MSQNKNRLYLRLINSFVSSEFSHTADKLEQFTFKMASSPSNGQDLTSDILSFLNISHDIYLQRCSKFYKIILQCYHYSDSIVYISKI